MARSSPEPRADRHGSAAGGHGAHQLPRRRALRQRAALVQGLLAAAALDRPCRRHRAGRSPPRARGVTRRCRAPAPGTTARRTRTPTDFSSQPRAGASWNAGRLPAAGPPPPIRRELPAAWRPCCCKLRKLPTGRRAGSEQMEHPQGRARSQRMPSSVASIMPTRHRASRSSRLSGNMPDALDKLCAHRYEGQRLTGRRFPPQAGGTGPPLAPCPPAGVARPDRSDRRRRADQHMLKHYGAVAGIVGGVTLLQLANTLLSVVLPLHLALDGYSGTTAGLVDHRLRRGLPRRLRRHPRLIRDVGHIRAFAVLAAVCSVTSMVFAASQSGRAVVLPAAGRWASARRACSRWSRAGSVPRHPPGPAAACCPSTWSRPRSRSSAASCCWARSTPPRRLVRGRRRGVHAVADPGGADPHPAAATPRLEVLGPRELYRRGPGRGRRLRRLGPAQQRAAGPYAGLRHQARPGPRHAWSGC